MQDLAHEWGSDLSIGPVGDLSLSAGTDQTRQRIIRRLLTNPADYLWQLDYGGGLGGFIGQPVQTPRIRAAVRAQIFKEASISQSPQPVINLTYSNSDPGAVSVTVVYTDLDASLPQSLTLPLGANP